MNRPQVFSLRDRWFTASVGITVAIAVAGAIAGFAWLPMQQQGVRFSGVWDAICSAAGLVRASPSADPVVQAGYPTTRVEVTPQMMSGADAEAVGLGATLALRCSMCHGARGLSQAESPNLPGQPAVAVYKQLRDFRSGARSSAVMQPLVADLSDSDMRELAEFYAYLPRLPAVQPPSTEPPPRIVESGAPMRGIAPCGACHGVLDSKAGATRLEGQPAAYLRSQLQAFASGGRRNDISEQMRNVARRMTAAEIEAASQYLAVH